VEKIILPRHLSAASRRWAEKISETWALECDKVKVLIQAAEQLDRIAQARRKVKRDGAYYTDRWGCPKSHPALADERNGRVVFSRLVRELNLTEEPEGPRPPGLRYK
jgi:hypothetical protein